MGKKKQEQVKLIKATSSDLNDIYAMGYDIWGEGVPYFDYIEECKGSVKYQSGTWYVLKVKNENVSSCIIYQLSHNVVGIGSLATKKDKRGSGFGSLLINKILSENIGKTYFLWSDIDPIFYKKIGFALVDSKIQLYEDSYLMYYPQNASIDNKQLPTYF